MGGSRGSGLGPTSYFHTILPVFGSRAMTKPRPLHPRYPGKALTTCSIAPPATITFASARIGGSAEVDIAIDHDGRGVNNANQFVRGFGRESPLLHELPGVGLADSLLAGIVPDS